MKSNGTAVAGGTKVLLRHPKEESFSVNVMKGKFWCMLSMSGKVIRRWEMNYYTRMDLLG